MARRRGRPGSHLITDDNTGFTTYAERVQLDYWGNYTSRPLERNMQEISSPLGDPYPVKVFRGSQYEVVNPCQFELLPQKIGKTNKPFLQNSAYAQSGNFNFSIGTATIGCTFVVH